MDVEPPPLCEYHNKDSIMVCQTCKGEHICFQCINTAHKGHNIVPMKKKKEQKFLSTKCAKHGRNLIYVCKTCKKELLCWSCYFPKHKGHNILDFEAYMRGIREKFQHHHGQDALPKSNVELVSAQIKQRRDELKTQIDVIADNFAEEYSKHLKRNQKLRVKLPKFKTSKTKSSEVEKLFGTIKIK